MRSILVGVVALVLAAGGPAYGGSVVDDTERPRAAVEPEVIEPPPAPQHMVVHDRAPFREVVVEEYHSAGSEWGMGVASSMFSIFYTPVRLVLGVTGAALGGVEGWLTGGDLRTARSMWRPTVEGDYYVRPDHLDGTERFEVGNFRPVVRERYTLHGRHAVLHEEETVTVDSSEVAVAPSNTDVEPIERALEDAGDDR